MVSQPPPPPPRVLTHSHAHNSRRNVESLASAPTPTHTHTHTRPTRSAPRRPLHSHTSRMCSHALTHLFTYLPTYSLSLSSSLTSSWCDTSCRSLLARCVYVCVVRCVAWCATRFASHRRPDLPPCFVNTSPAHPPALLCVHVTTEQIIACPCMRWGFRKRQRRRAYSHGRLHPASRWDVHILARLV